MLSFNRKNKTYQAIARLTTVICLGVILFAFLNAGYAAVGSKICIDGNLPLTGPMAAFCGDYPKAFDMGIDDACKQLSIPRETFVIDFQDNTGKISQGVSVMRKQLLNPPAIYMSCPSPLSRVIAREISNAGILHLLVAFDAYICRNGPNRVRILPHYKIEGPVYIEYAKKLKAKKVFVFLNTNPAYNDEFDKIVQPGLAKLGIQSHREDFDFDNKDFKSMALKAAQYKPDLIMIAGWSVHMYPILGALRNYGLVRNGNVLCTLDFIDLIHNRTPISEIAGVPFITPQYEISSNPGKKAWAKRFEQLYKKDPGYVEAYAYDTGRILVAAYKKFGKLDAQSIRKVLPFHGICGDINIDKDGDLDTKLEVAQVMPDGTVQAVK